MSLTEPETHPPRRFNPLIRTLIVYFGYWVVTLVISAAASAIFGESMRDPIVENGLRFTLFLVYFGCIAALTTFVDRRPLHVLQLKVDSNAIKWFLITAAITGVVIVGATTFANTVFPDHVGEPREIVNLHYFNGFMAAFFLQGFPEEITFRGYLSQTLKTNPVRTLVITSLVFMALHIHFLIQAFILIAQGDPLGPLALADGIIQIIYPLVFGAFAFVMMYLHRTVWAAVAVHFGIHIFRVICEGMGLAGGTLVTAFFDVLFAALTAYIFFKNREAFRPENNRLVYD